MKKIKNSKAITLIALIITIIVLLILAGVTIVTLTGENGLLARARAAKNTNYNATMQENITLGDYENILDSYIFGNRDEIQSSKSEFIESIDFTVTPSTNEIEINVTSVLNDESKLLGYHCFAINANDKTKIYGEMSKASKITISGLDLNTQYYVYVIAYDMYNNYIKSDSKQINTLDGPIITINDIYFVYCINKSRDTTVSEVEDCLFNKNTNEGGTYKGIMMLTDGSYIDFTVTKNIRMYAYGHTYSDSGGISGKNAVFKKYNITSLQFEDYKIVSTKADGTRYELVTLEPGRYRIYTEKDYTNYDEWEYEVIE